MASSILQDTLENGFGEDVAPDIPEPCDFHLLTVARIGSRGPTGKMMLLSAWVEGICTECCTVDLDFRDTLSLLLSLSWGEGVLTYCYTVTRDFQDIHHMLLPLNWEEGVCAEYYSIITGMILHTFR